MLPRCLPEARLEFCVVTGWDELRPGRYGLLEPDGSLPATAVDAADLVVVPGLAFDETGARLGRGGGYYDRAFPPPLGVGPVLFGYAFHAQIVSVVPCAAHDRRVDAVATERGVLRPGPGGVHLDV